jgi:hypothetical protein
MVLKNVQRFLSKKNVQSFRHLKAESRVLLVSLVPSPVVPARLVGLVDGRGIGKGARVAVRSRAVGQVEVGVADVAEEEHQVGLVAHHVLHRGRGVVREAKVPDHGDPPRVALGPDGRHRPERVDAAHGVGDGRVAALVVVLGPGLQSLEADMVDDAGGVVLEALEGVELAVHERLAGGLVEEGVGGEAVAHDAAHGAGVQRLDGAAHLELPCGDGESNRHQDRTRALARPN